MPATLAQLTTGQLVARKVALILELRALAVPGTTPLSDPRVVEAARDIRTINNLLDARGVSTRVD